MDSIKYNYKPLIKSINSFFDFEASFKNKFAGSTFNASASLRIISKEGFAFPDSIPLSQSKQGFIIKNILQSRKCDIYLITSRKPIVYILMSKNINY